MQKKTQLWFGALAALSLTLAACGGSKTAPSTGGDTASKEENKLVIYTARNKEIYEDLVPKFEAKHPELKGNVEVLGMGAQQIIERVTAEKANPQADFWWGGTQQSFELAAKQGLLASVKPTFADKMEARYKDKDGQWYGEMLLPEIIAYNNQAVKPEDAPKDWDDLLDPKWKGKIIIRDVAASGTMRTIYTALIDRFDKKDGKPDGGFDWLKKLEVNVKGYASNPTDLYLKLGRQEGVVTAWNLQDIQLQADKQNMPFGVVIPKSGAPILVDGVGVVKSAKHPQAAMKFMEFLFDEKNREDQATRNYQISTIPMDKSKLPAWLQKLDLKPMDVRWDVMGTNEKEWIKNWEQNIKGKGGK